MINQPEWGKYDNVAICLDCSHQHLIPKEEQVTEQPWLDWLHKHPGHITFVMPHRALSKLGERLIHNADVKTAYAASAAYTCTLASLASDTNLLAGRESTALVNTSNKYLDVIVAGFLTTGTSPTDVRQIEVHAVGALNDTPLYPDVFDGTDSAETVTSLNIKNSICRPLAVLGTSNTNDRTYPFGPVMLSLAFGGYLPPAHVLFVTHNTGVNLNSTGGNQALYNTPVYETVI